MMKAGKDYAVRVITAYENKRVGQVFHPPALLRDSLVRSGRVELVQPTAQEDAQAPLLLKRKPGRLGLVK